MAIADRAATIYHICQALQSHGAAAARDIIRAEYAFGAIAPESRRYSETEALRIFARDGFIDRYSGQRLVFPGILRLLSRLFPDEFPFQRNWRMSETHPAYWELFPTIDHLFPIARGGAENADNCVTTSMLRNAAKANWTLEELGWTLRDPGSLDQWDGLMGFFVEFVRGDKSLLEDKYLRRWHHAATWDRGDSFP